MKNSDQEKFINAKYDQDFNKDLAKARYDTSKNRKAREFVPQHDNLVEIRIKQAMHDGKFDDLPGKGKPIEFDRMSNIPEHLRAGYQALKNSGHLVVYSYNSYNNYTNLKYSLTKKTAFFK